MSGAIHFVSGKRRWFDIRYIAWCSVLGTLVLLNHPYSSMSNQPHFPSSCIALSSGQPSPLCKLEPHLKKIRIRNGNSMMQQLVFEVIRRMCSRLSAENIDSLKDKLVSITVHPIQHFEWIFYLVPQLPEWEMYDDYLCQMANDIGRYIAQPNNLLDSLNW